ncbi:MAG: DUF3726 domain-containing protein [Pseudomonadota bacterium]|nr:DUF3726 domain-containing protein [Pseudomonadota bacterium]MEC7237967.1 DUF3726 domain-containing protein [Pseudomonadota bacterium]
MSWSLGETAALALKATRGAGMSWGLAEETAASVVWLHSRGLPGMSALCGYLGSANTFRTDEPACPIITGCALIDGSTEAPDRLLGSRDLGLVQAPLLLLPFVARLDPGTIWLHAPGLGGVADQTDGDRWQSHCLRGAASCRIEYRDRPQIDPGRERLTRLGEQFACCVDRLGTFAHRTYAPATGQSRMSGAGAGLTDND